MTYRKRTTAAPIAILLAIFGLVSCASNPMPDDRELRRQASTNYLAPAIEYGVVSDPELDRLVSEGEQYYSAGNLPEATRSFSSAESYVTERVGSDSTYLLPILDWQIRIKLKTREINEADKLQHRYHQIVLKNFSTNEKVKRDSQYRIACWNYFIGDWYEAMFDFEDLIEEIKRLETPSERDNSILDISEDFADSAAQNCRPQW